MKLHQLRYLAAVAQSGLNITAAAQKLHTSQPGVSKQIKLLEDELGFQIFVREGRNLTRITPAASRSSSGPCSPAGGPEHQDLSTGCG
jgi:LysR family cys regulon transcriptional activator